MATFGHRRLTPMRTARNTHPRSESRNPGLPLPQIAGLGETYARAIGGVRVSVGEGTQVWLRQE